MSDEPKNWPPPDAADWVREALIDMPAPTEDMDPVEAEEVQAQKIERKLLETIPKSYRWATGSSPDLFTRVKSPRRLDGTPLSVEALLAAAPSTSWMLLSGPASAGKTSIACAMLRERCRAMKRTGVFVHAFRLGIARIQSKAGTGEADIVEQAMTAPMVLIDDVGSERDTATNAMSDVIFERHAEDLPTWITTGLTRAQLTTRYGAGFVRRITERAIMIRVGKEEAS